MEVRDGGNVGFGWWTFVVFGGFGGVVERVFRRDDVKRKIGGES